MFYRSIKNKLARKVWLAINRIFKRESYISCDVYILRPVVDYENGFYHFDIFKYIHNVISFDYKINYGNSEYVPLSINYGNDVLFSNGIKIIYMPSIIERSHKLVRWALILLNATDRNKYSKRIYFTSDANGERKFNCDHDLIVSTKNSRSKKTPGVVVSFDDYLKYRNRDDMKIVYVIPIRYAIL